MWGSGNRCALLLHGSMADSSTWWRLGPSLAERGYRVVALDLPGHGASPANPAASVESHAAAVLSSAPNKVDLAVGHSLGGVVLAAVVSQLRPGHAVYLDAPLDCRSTAVDRVEVRARFTAMKDGRTLERLVRDRPSWHQRDREVEVASARRWDVPTAVSLAADLAGRDLTPSAGAHSVMLRAEPSDFVPADHASRLEAHGFDVVSIPGGAHSLHYSHIDEVMAVLAGLGDVSGTDEPETDAPALDAR
ncbi:alpha/beta hydrolase family protein [Oryzihumus leptocrescens]|uniref:Alpha/beta hydrolase family protein n=1 Tax=Oryzihumus leptocrescens TaxID=297536 RepID=A0A542ZFK9_9MICO|nr:alpha/beta hydrolase [Oryzihumus leptocrescens]TQL59020.1 alpha/beta hydrolase family protein [Oryzihumus leptocrescens]